MVFKVKIHHTAQKQLLSFPCEAQREIASAIDELEENARPSGCKKLRETKLWRIKTGRYRVVYVIDDKAKLITVVKVGVRHEDTSKGV